MKTTILLTFMVACARCFGQTNAVPMMIPAGTILENPETIHFDGTIKPVLIQFRLPSGAHVQLHHFNYDAKDFIPLDPSAGSGMAFRWARTVNVYCLRATTNYDAAGRVTYIDTIFDCWPPQVQNVSTLDDERRNMAAAARLGVPFQVYEKILEQALKDWPGNYARQDYEIEKQCGAWRKLHADQGR